MFIIEVEGDGRATRQRHRGSCLARLVPRRLNPQNRSMKSLRMLAVYAMAALLFFGFVRATSPTSIQCRLCNEWWVTSRPDCPSCGLIPINGALSDTERTALRRLLASEGYRAANDRDRFIMTYEAVSPRDPGWMARVYLFAAEQAEGEARGESYLLTAVRWLRADLAGWPASRDRSKRVIEIADTLRRAGRFPEARQELASLESIVQPLPAETVAELEFVRELVAEGVTTARRSLHGWAAQVKPTFRAPATATFGLPLAKAAKSLKHPKGHYPASMVVSGFAGEALVAVVVEPSGAVSDARVIRVTQKEFEAPALKLARQCEITIEREDGVGPVEALLEIVYSIADE